MKVNAIKMANQKPTLLIHGFRGLLKKMKRKVEAVKNAVYLLKPASPNNMPVIIQSTSVNGSFVNHRNAISMRPRLRGASMVSGSNPIARTCGNGAATTASTAIKPHTFAEGRLEVK